MQSKHSFLTEVDPIKNAAMSVMEVTVMETGAEEAGGLLLETARLGHCCSGVQVPHRDSDDGRAACALCLSPRYLPLGPALAAWRSLPVPVAGRSRICRESALRSLRAARVLRGTQRRMLFQRVRNHVRLRLYDYKNARGPAPRRSPDRSDPARGHQSGHQ